MNSILLFRVSADFRVTVLINAMVIAPLNQEPEDYCCTTDDVRVYYSLLVREVTFRYRMLFVVQTDLKHRNGGMGWFSRI